MIFEPTICLVQTMHLTFTSTNTIFKRTKPTFHMTHVTMEFHRVRPKWFLRLWYVWHKQCTYLASILALSPNELNEASTWASSPRSTIGCVQNDFWAYGMLAQTVQLSCTDTNNISKWTKTRLHMTHVTLEFHRVHPKWFLSLWYIHRKQCS
jgi:hypothetical protein